MDGKKDLYMAAAKQRPDNFRKLVRVGRKGHVGGMIGVEWGRAGVMSEMEGHILSSLE